VRIQLGVIHGSVDMRNVAVDEVWSSMTLTGPNNVYLYFSDVIRPLADEFDPLGDLVIDKLDGIVTMMNDGYVANFIGIRGDFDFNGFTLKVGY